MKRSPCYTDDGLLMWFLILICFAMLASQCEGTARADDNVHLKSESTCTTAKGNTVTLPPGYFLHEAAFAALDVEVRRLQDAETKLTAENKSLRDTAAGWQPGWKSLLTATLIGMAVVLAIEGL